MLMHKKGLTLLLSTLLFLSFTVPLVPLGNSQAVFWLYGWSYRAPFTYTASEHDSQANFTLTIPETFFDSVRVTEGDGVTLLPVWLQEPNIVWARYPTANTTYFLYWGNSEAEAVWNETAVFVDVITGVVGAWTMNEGEGATAYDYSGYGNNGTIMGASWIDGKYNKALLFDGIDDLVTVPHSDSLKSPSTFTLCIWVYIEAFVRDFHHLVDKWVNVSPRNGFYLGYRGLTEHGTPSANVRKTVFVVYNNDSSRTMYSDVRLEAEKWYFIVAIASETENILEIYDEEGLIERKTVDGMEAGEESRKGLTIGAQTLEFGQCNAITDEGRIYNRALSEEEIENVYSNYGDPTLEAGKVLVRKWLTLSAFDFYTIPPVILSGETYYFRSDSYQVNTVTAYGLDVDYTNTAVFLSSNGATGATVQYGFRIYQLHTGGGKTELTGGSPEAAITLSSNSSGYQTATWSCAETDWDLGRDAIQIAVYVKFDSGNWIAVANYVTPSIMSGTLEASTWTFRVYLYYLDNGASTQTRFYFGSGTYHSEISGIAFTEASIFDMMMFSLMVGDLIMFFRLPLDLLFGSWWYFLLILAVAGAFYIRYRNLVVILVLWTLFAGAGGLVGLLIPNPIDIAIWVLLSLGLTAVLWRVFR